ncbi:ABC transporter permease [Herpetosiphon llansteffanensis]|uniref:ABC transporter permease n=1 Tax=Herpetosiphon llansteffanensis TaxID=2094568 RepID=UPI000D7CE989
MMAKILADKRIETKHGRSRPVAKRHMPWGTWALTLNAIFVYTFLYVPIIVLVLFSFNAAKVGAQWQGFTLQWYNELFADARLGDALWTSLKIAGLSTIIATTIGTLAALALEKRGWRGRKAFDTGLYLPVIIPDVVMAVSLLGFFTLAFRQFQALLGLNLAMGLWTVIISHVAFNISFVTVVVGTSLANFDRRLEEAAADLGATPWQTFWKIKFPLIGPGVLGGALLSFTLSLDDFVVTFFTRGPGVNTLTTEVYGRIKKSISPEINAISSLMLLGSTILVLTSLWMQRRRQA